MSGITIHYPMVQRKMEALWLESQGLRHYEIARLTGITEETLHSYLIAYQEGGIERLKQLNLYRPSSALMVYRGSIEASLLEHPPASIKEAAAIIETLTGIKRSPTQNRVFLKAIGMQCRKVGVIPAKADPNIQEEFKKKS
jgi:transposase